jgi:hypothetical protein
MNSVWEKSRDFPKTHVYELRLCFHWKVTNRDKKTLLTIPATVTSKEQEDW